MEPVEDDSAKEVKDESVKVTVPEEKEGSGSALSGVRRMISSTLSFIKLKVMSLFSSNVPHSKLDSQEERSALNETAASDTPQEAEK